MATTLMPFGPRSFFLPSSNPPGMDVIAAQNREYLAFDDTTEETCYSPAFYMPLAYAGGTLAAYIGGFFSSEDTAEDEAVMAVSIEAITVGDGVNVAAASSWDTENTCEIDPPATAGLECQGVCTLTNKDNVAAGDLVRLRLARKVDNAADTATGDFNVLCLELREA